ncbi:MAG: ATP phosphoribosyltransferase [Clostridia bacterium]|nr:ATP phosphoribosyltransferase [Clostridia bacterium]
MVNVALPKGRLGEKVYDLFERAGYSCDEMHDKGRKLIFENIEKGIRYFWVKPSDVPVYVERGVADLGIAGKDVLLERHPDVYELLDLALGKCRMCAAAKADFFDDGEKTLKVATEFVNIASEYYARQGRDIDIIKLHGSVELAPILGLSDVIVDIVETGTSLRENNLVITDEILPISARLIANKANFKFKTKEIEDIVNLMRKQVKEND